MHKRIRILNVPVLLVQWPKTVKKKCIGVNKSPFDGSKISNKGESKILGHGAVCREET